MILIIVAWYSEEKEKGSANHKLPFLLSLTGNDMMIFKTILASQGRPTIIRRIYALVKVLCDGVNLALGC